MAEKDLKVVKLSRDNKVILKWQFQNVLKAKNLGTAVTGEPIASDNDQALALLGSALSDENLLKIISCNNFKEAWLTIERCFENKTAYEPIALYRRLFTYKIDSAEGVGAGICEIQGIATQLADLKEPVGDEILIGTILESLPSSFEMFEAVWKQSVDQGLDAFISSLMADASGKVTKETNATALLARDKKKKLEEGKCAKDQCRYCKEFGHWLRDCPKLKDRYDPDYNAKKKPDEEQEELAF